MEKIILEATILDRGRGNASVIDLNLCSMRSWLQMSKAAVTTYHQVDYMLISHLQFKKSCMHCQRCQKTIRNSEGVTCHDCDSRFHLKCVSSTKDLEGGDWGYQWKCAVCQNPAGRCSSHTQIVLNAINQISEKFELINKIQIPKLNGDLLLLKSTADTIVRQNEDMLNKINQFQKAEQKKVTRSGPSSGSTRNHRRLPLNLTNKTDDEEVAILSGSEKCARYKTRRRSYHLYKLLLLVNRKLHRTRTPRNKSPR